MDNKETLQLYRSDSILLSDSTYYKHIFKKTEKIVCAVFYILENTEKGQHSVVAENVSVSAQRALDAVLRTLTCRSYAATEELYAFLNTLVALESQIRVAHATQLLHGEAADLLCFELQNVMRSLRQYLAHDRNNAPDLSFAEIPDARAASASALRGMRTAPSSVPASLGTHPKRQVVTQHTERQEAIKDILATKGQSTIKEISENIKDCSEKTIQRELNAMISAGVVQKEGERRWSRYSLAGMS